MEAKVVQRRRLWDGVLEMTVSAQERGTDPLSSPQFAAAGVSMPSVKVAELLVSHICWSNNFHQDFQDFISATT